MKFNFFHKVLIIVAVLAVTFAYAYYERSKFYNDSSMNDLVLKELPSFDVVATHTQETINSLDFNRNSEGTFVHIWGTWCGPCEKEMPDFLAYASKIQDTGVKFLLVAVNDEDAKIKKFLSRFPNIPKNVTFVQDTQNKVMDLLGTLKVPETFLFSKEGKHINKFIGPQDWIAESYVTRLNFWLNKEEVDLKKVESH